MKKNNREKLWEYKNGKNKNIIKFYQGLAGREWPGDEATCACVCVCYVYQMLTCTIYVYNQ